MLFLFYSSCSLNVTFRRRATSSAVPGRKQRSTERSRLSPPTDDRTESQLPLLSPHYDMLGHPGHPTISNLTQQMQQAGQQQQQQQQQGQQQLQGQQQQNPNQGPPPNGQDYNLSNVLHFLQTEWRKYERDRNEWEIERAEMRVSPFSIASDALVSTVLQARIALLEGERRSFENVKLDLMRRIKMLEYALRVER